jgi:hypothetical protein
MKLKSFLYIALFGILVITGCQKEDAKSGSSGTITATINGESFTASSVNVNVVSNGGTNVRSIVATNGNQVLTLTFVASGTGAYTIGSSSSTTITYTLGSTASIATSGTITLTTNSDADTDGTFGAAGTGLTISNGTLVDVKR